MNRSEVLAYYDEETAKGYDERFLLAEWPKHGTYYELELLRELVDEGSRWLDVGCGTGWFLSQFPATDRAGLDISSAQLTEARKKNPDVDLRRGDFVDDVAEWNGAWSVVSCMWMPWCYLASMAEVEQLVDNLLRWTAPGGALLLTAVIDMEDLRPHTVIEYDENIDVWGGHVAIPGYFWTWQEPSGVVNENMVAVHSDHFVRLLEGHFDRIEVVRYPVLHEGWVARKAIVATGRRAMSGEHDPSMVERQPPPPPPSADAPALTPPQLAATLPARTMLQAIVRRVPSILRRIVTRSRSETEAPQEPAA